MTSHTDITKIPDFLLQFPHSDHHEPKRETEVPP
jgi:hypothetical protein